MAYNIAGHALLSADAASLDAAAFAEHAALAHDLLGLTGTALTGEAEAAAKRYLVLQVNYQVETGVDAAVYRELTRGRRRHQFRDELGLVRPGLLDQVAELLEEAEGGDGSWGDRDYGVITSFR